MALKRLTTAEMVQISGPWTTDGSDARKAIQRAPALAGLVPHLDAAHAGLHAARPAAQDPRLAEIKAEEAEVDDRHDALVRGIDLVLEGAALLAGAGARAADIDATRAVLTPAPAGLAVVSSSYRNEAGAAALLASRLLDEPTAKAVLQSISVDKKRTLASFVNERIQAGKKLGDLEDERVLLDNTPSDDDQGVANITARNAWIKAVNALVANAELADLPPKTDTLVFSALRQIEKKADRRGKPAPDHPVAGPVDTGDDSAPTMPDAGGEIPAKKQL